LLGIINMNKGKLKTLKLMLTEGLGFNSKSISDTLFQFGLVFSGALLGGIISISLSKNLTSVELLLFIIFFIFITSSIFKIITNRKRLWRWLKQLN